MVQYVNIQEASRLTGISVITLRRAVRTKRFPYIRMGGTPRGKLLFNLQDLAQILANEAYSSIHSQEVEKND